MESFSNDGSTVDQSTQIVVDFFNSVQNNMDTYIHEIESLEKNYFVSQNAFCKSVNEALRVMQTHRAQMLSYAQTLAGYMHHFAGRVSDLRERERMAELRETQLIETSPYIIERAFNDIFVRTGNAFSQAQAKSLNLYYQMVRDKRFHRAMIQDIRYDSGPYVICRIKSTDPKHQTHYVTSLSKCSCDDFKLHQRPCKHMLFLAYHTGYLFLNKEKLEASMQQYIEELKKNKIK